MATTTAKTLVEHQGRMDSFGRNIESVEEFRAISKMLDEEARDNWDNPAWHRQMAQDLADYLDYGFTNENLFSTYFQTETVGEFDRVRLVERRGLKVYYTARGGYIDETQLRTEQWEIPRDTLGFHVSEFEDKLRAGFATAIAEITGLAEARLEAEVNRRIFNLLQSAVPSGSSYYATAAGLSKSTLDANIRAVKDAIKPNGAGPAPVTIIGRASMTDQISDFTGFAPEAIEEIRLRGRLGTYRGCNIVTVNNYADEDGTSYMPANELWVFGGNVGKFVMYGPMQVKSWTENTVDYVHYRARKDIGGLVHHPEQSRRFVDSAVTP
jgi:hypothetical protein